MRELDLLIRGALAGVIIAAPVGPVNVLCMQRTVLKGWRAGVISGLGSAAADTLYGAIAGFSITFVIAFLERELAWIRLAGGILLAVIGAVYFFKPPASLNKKGEDESGPPADFHSTLLLTLTNPTTVLSFLAVFAALGLAQRREWWLTSIMVGGIFCGSMAWWVILSSVVNRLRDRMTDRALRWMNRVAGLAIGGFGVVSFALGRQQL